MYTIPNHPEYYKLQCPLQDELLPLCDTTFESDLEVIASAECDC